MKVAIVGTYPAGTFEKFKNYFSEKPEIEVVEVDTQKKFDALTEADAIVLRILKMPKEVVARIKGLKMIMRWEPALIRLILKKQENMEFMSAILREQMLMLWRSLRWH